ncbi:yuaR, partial [Symbiodinium necroappetens]
EANHSDLNSAVAGPLASNINFTDSEGRVHEPPFTFLNDGTNTWNSPRDYGNHKQVLKFLERKAEIIAACSETLDRPDGHDTYNLLQYMGMQAQVHDIEWLRWAFGGYPITVLGFSYGTRVAAAYASQFPGAVQRVAVSGVEASNPDLLEFAKESGLNTVEILGFVQSQCAESTCRKNPFTKGEINEPGFYFDGDINAAVKELFHRFPHKTVPPFWQLSIFYLIPALDMAGRWQANQVAKFIASNAADRTLMPAAYMFVLNAQGAYGWPQLPTPVGFSNPTVDAVAVNTLYDERTGMNM